MTANEHAVQAAKLLAGAEARSQRLAGLTAEERLEMAATGGFARANADLEWTVELAQAHALTALALALAPPGARRR